MAIKVGDRVKIPVDTDYGNGSAEVLQIKELKSPLSPTGFENMYLLHVVSSEFPPVDLWFYEEEVQELPPPDSATPVRRPTW